MPTSGMAGQRVLLRQNSRTGAFCMGSDYCQKLLADVGGGMITAGSSSRPLSWSRYTGLVLASTGRAFTSWRSRRFTAGPPVNYQRR